MPSDKILEQKKKLVEKLTNKLKDSCAGVLVEYKGINVEQDTKLRKELREANIEYSVIKNTLLTRAVKEANLEELSEFLKGSTALAVSKDDYVSAAKILDNFSKENKFFNIKSGFIDENVVDAKQITELAKLPDKNVLIAKVLGGLNSPIVSFVYTLSGLQKGLVVALNAIKEQKSA